jgi:hypothetical protein
MVCSGYNIRFPWHYSVFCSYILIDMRIIYRKIRISACCAVFLHILFLRYKYFYLLYEFTKPDAGQKNTISCKST